MIHCFSPVSVGFSFGHGSDSLLQPCFGGLLFWARSRFVASALCRWAFLLGSAQTHCFSPVSVGFYFGHGSDLCSLEVFLRGADRRNKNVLVSCHLWSSLSLASADRLVLPWQELDRCACRTVAARVPAPAAGPTPLPGHGGDGNGFKGQ